MLLGIVRNGQWLKQARGFVLRGIGIVAGLIVIYILANVLVKVRPIIAVTD
jgi:hypothetical protein